MRKHSYVTRECRYYIIRQLKLPLEKIIDIAALVYSFCDVMDHIDLTKYFAIKGSRTGCLRCDAIKLLKKD